MALLAERDRKTLTTRFDQLTKTVRLVMFTQEFECLSCRSTRELLEETASLSDKIDLAVYDLVTDQQKAETYGVQLVPAVIVEGEKDHGIRFFGAPAGYEFSSLVEDILAVGTETIPLSQASREKLAGLAQRTSRSSSLRAVRTARGRCTPPTCWRSPRTTLQRIC